MLARTAEILADVEASAESHILKHREQYAQATYGLSYDYLRKIGRVHKRPSGRVLDNMGLEVWVRDPATGLEERLDFDYTCDWTPRKPKLKKRD